MEVGYGGEPVCAHISHVQALGGESVNLARQISQLLVMWTMTKLSIVHTAKRGNEHKNTQRPAHVLALLTMFLFVGQYYAPPPVCKLQPNKDNCLMVLSKGRRSGT